MRTSSDYIMTLPYRTIHDRLEADRVIEQLREAKKQKPRTQRRNVYVRDKNRYDSRTPRMRKITGSWILRIRPRLGKNSPYRDMYASGKGATERGEYYRPVAQDIKRIHADRLDIYLSFQPKKFSFRDPYDRSFLSNLL